SDPLSTNASRARHRSPRWRELPDRPDRWCHCACGGLARAARTANNRNGPIQAEECQGALPKQWHMPTASHALRAALIPILSTVAGIGVLAIAIYYIRSWLRDNDGPAASLHELLADYRDLHRRGELSDEEFRSIKGRMAPSIKGMSGTIRNDD